jgi:heat shock protein HtpX
LFCSSPTFRDVGLSVTASLLGVNRYLTANGLNFGMLLVFCGLMGFGGSFISLFMSKTIAKWSTGARDRAAAEFHRTVGCKPSRPWLPAPSCPCRKWRSMTAANALPPAPARAIRWWRCPPACCRHDQGRREAVLAHEVAHIANGDMVTLT